MKRTLLLLLALCLVQTGEGRVRLPSVIGSGMVLQRDSQAAIRGWAAPGARVELTASWDALPYAAYADGKGYWHTRIPTPSAGGSAQR